MKKQYITPKSKVRSVHGKTDILDRGHVNMLADSIQGVWTTSAGKDRGDYDDEDYEDVW